MKIKILSLKITTGQISNQPYQKPSIYSTATSSQYQETSFLSFGTALDPREVKIPFKRERIWDKNPEVSAQFLSSFPTTPVLFHKSCSLCATSCSSPAFLLSLKVEASSFGLKFIIDNKINKQSLQKMP